MKKKLFFMSLTAAMMFASCSNDDVINENDGGIPVLSNGAAYVAVNISSAQDTRGIDKGFEYGESYEHEVTSADFYFYDKDGAFVTQANVWRGGKENEANPTENIEYFGKNVVVLKNITQKNFPKYVVTVLNKPADFTKVPSTLAEMEEALTGIINQEVTKDNTTSITNFVMTTTSYLPVKDNILNTTNGQPIYFATELKEDNFLKNPDVSVTDDNAVDIYVERLAAKVLLEVDNKQLKPVEGDSIYAMKATIAGKPNANDENTDSIGAEDIRIKFDGWGLNTTAKQSHMVKNINNWIDLGFTWNEGASNHRSLWGKGTAYGTTISSSTIGKEYFNYNSLNDMKVKIGENAYCAENTNTAECLRGHLAEGATSVILSATILYPSTTTKDGNTVTEWAPIDLVRYNGVLYTQDQFKTYVLNNLNVLGRLNYWTVTGTKTNADGTTETEYRQITVSDIAYTHLGQGIIQFTLTADATTSDKKWYAREADKENVGKYKYTEVDIATLKTNLDSFKANYYKGGKMYYNIPIEHLRDGASVANDEGLKEGHYGVVRNHYYKLTVNKLENLGKGVFNPDEDIVPDNPKDEKNNYQVGVKINILSWRVVSQSVGL